MKKRRIFIAVNLPEKIKSFLAECKNKWPELPARWASPQNLHITLIFLGYLSNEELLDVCSSVKKVALKHGSFSLALNKIIYGPAGQPLSKIKMVWAVGNLPKELSLIKKETKELLNFNAERKRSINHVTLARIKQFGFRAMDQEEIPEISENINLSFQVKSVEVMESKLKKNGVEYAIIKSFFLGN